MRLVCPRQVMTILLKLRRKTLNVNGVQTGGGGCFGAAVRRRFFFPGDKLSYFIVVVANNTGCLKVAGTFREKSLNSLKITKQVKARATRMSWSSPRPTSVTLVLLQRFVGAINDHWRISIDRNLKIGLYMQLFHICGIRMVS